MFEFLTYMRFTRGEYAPKKSSVKASVNRTRATETCVLCCQKIVEGKEQILLCRGKCSGLMHRYCAGVSLTQFESMKMHPDENDATPTFECIVCSQQTYRREIEELKNTIQDLRLEVRQLRDTIKRPTSDADHKKSYADTTRSRQQKEASKNKVIFQRKDKDRIRAKVGQRASCQSVSGSEHKEILSEIQRQVVSGARRVWGTLQSATLYAVRATIYCKTD